MPGAAFTTDKIREFYIHPWAHGGATNVGAISNTGIQYTQIVNANVANTYAVVNGMAFNVITETYPAGRGKIIELEAGLTAEWQANATTLCTVQWRGRNLAPLADWVIFRTDTEQSVTTAWASNTYSGYIQPQPGLNTVPFEVQMLFRTNHAVVGIARGKSSTY